MQKGSEICMDHDVQIFNSVVEAESCTTKLTSYTVRGIYLCTGAEICRSS